MVFYEKIPSRKVADMKWVKSPITKHIIRHHKVPEGVSEKQLSSYDKKLLNLIKFQKERDGYRRINLSKSRK